MPMIDGKDNYAIFNTSTNKIIESWPTSHQAEHFCKAINDHEARNDRMPVYKVAWRLPEGMWEVL